MNTPKQRGETDSDLIVYKVAFILIISWGLIMILILTALEVPLT